ncbi:MAG: hypothetical protein KGJ86_01520 [Chloroflexota bacterium]|nr:hypothetical protein [Chloroflexota bacterium]
MNVIDTLSAGFSAANRRLWIAVIPIVVDLFLWLGPKLVAGPALATQIESLLHQQYAGAGLGLQQIVASFNLFSALVLYLPSLIVRLDSIAPLASAAPVIPVGSPWLFLLGGVAILLAGLWISCLYLGFLGQLVRGSATNVLALLSAVWRYWGRVALFLLLAALALGVAAIPLSVAYLFLTSLSAAAGDFVALIIQIGIVWAIVYLFFTVEAVVLNDVGPVRAARYSIMVISRNFWASVTFVGLTFLISLGLPIAWQLIAGNPAGLVVGIIGNAYIGTGISAAGFLFYQDRLERVQRAAATRPAKETE